MVAVIWTAPPDWRTAVLPTMAWTLSTDVVTLKAPAAAHGGAVPLAAGAFSTNVPAFFAALSASAVLTLLLMSPQFAFAYQSDTVAFWNDLPGWASEATVS